MGTRREARAEGSEMSETLDFHTDDSPSWMRSTIAAYSVAYGEGGKEYE